MKLLQMRNRLIAFGHIFLPCAAFAAAVDDWNEVVFSQVIAARKLPPDGAGTMAMVHIGIVDANSAFAFRNAIIRADKLEMRSAQ